MSRPLKESLKASSKEVNSWPQSRFNGPRIIGHRGASHHATENTLKAFSLASELGADMWELDARVTLDGVCVVSHDDDLQKVFNTPALISQTNFAELRALTHDRLASLQEVIDLAKSLNTGLYIELKDSHAGFSVWDLLTENSVSYAALGSFNASWVKALADANCDYPLSVLVPLNEDPFQLAEEAQASMIHLCWERASDNPQHLVTKALIEKARQRDLDIVLWHEERPKVIKALIELPVVGICSDRPELFVPYPSSPARNSVSKIRTQVVCHRGAEYFAPENTLAAFSRVFEQGLDWVEIDVQETGDGQLVILHDGTLERTVKGKGKIAELNWCDVNSLDAGSVFDPLYHEQRIPLLSQTIEMAKSFNKSLYIELKDVCVEKVLAQVQQQNFLADCFFWSFDAQKLAQIRTLDATANIMARAQDFDTIEQARDAYSACVIEIEASSKTLLQDVLDTRDLGCSVMLCYQGGDMDVFRKLIDLKPDLINLSKAHLWKQALYEHDIIA